jgi:hypothetical protein
MNLERHMFEVQNVCECHIGMTSNLKEALKLVKLDSEYITGELSYGSGISRKPR